MSILHYRLSTEPEPYLRYRVCPHRERYSFINQQNLLLDYLETECYGWIRSHDEKYTINYILLVLFQTFRSKGMLEAKYFIESDRKLLDVFDRKCVPIDQIRSLVKDYMSTREHFQRDYFTFLCPYGFETQIKSLFKYNYSDMIGYYCNEF